jgi:phosphatidylinositol-3,4,5-trisphosphate 3-phosphatase/dual-specificity protein phosphatase PTEN
LDLTYITPRIIAMGFPSQGTEALYRNPMDEVERFFQRRHPQHYRVYNLCSERKYDTKSLEGRWRRFPFDDHNAPAPIKLIPSFVADAAAFLRDDEHNVVAVHCKAGKGRTGLMVSCLLMAVVPSLREPQHALRYFDDMRTADGKGVTIASQRRYVRYYDAMLAKFAGQEAPPRPLPLWRIVVWTPILRSRAPFQAIDSLYFIVRENNEEKFDSRTSGSASLGKVFRTVAASPTVPQAMQVCYVFERSATGPLCPSLSGDLRFEFYQKSALLGRPEALFHFWLNTALLERPAGETLYKVELDKASKDKKHATYCEELCVQVHFQDDPVAMPPSYAAVKQRAMGRRQSMRAPGPPRGLGAAGGAEASSGDATPAAVPEPTPMVLASAAAPSTAAAPANADPTSPRTPAPAAQHLPQQAAMPETGKSGWRRFFS